MAVAAPLQSVPTAEQIREVTREVLSRPEFSGPSTWEQILFSLWRALAEWLKSFAAWSQQNPELARIVVIVLIAAGLGALIHLLYLALGDLLPFGRREEAAQTRAPRWEILEGAAKNWREALDAARKRLEEGDCRRAIWLAHRVLLGLLDEQEAVRFAGWKTNARYLVECATGHPWYATFAELTEAYEQTIYARRTAAPSSVESLISRVERLWKERHE